MVKVYYGSLQTQSSSMSSVSQSRVSGFQSLISAFSNFASSDGELNGHGYDAARAYATGIMIPYYQACILYSEGVADAANTLADDYSAKCGAEDLDEEKLRAEIESASRGCMALSASISGIRSKSKPAEGDSERIGRLESQLAAAEARIRETQEKLDNLLEFSSQSQLACNAANRYWLAVSKGLEGISASFSGGGFAFPSDVSWVDVVAQGWADREITLANAYTTAMEKVYNGEDLTETDLTAIERYAAEYPKKVNISALVKVKDIRELNKNYRAILVKLNTGVDISDQERGVLEDYARRYPNRVSDEIKEIIASFDELLDYLNKTKVESTLLSYGSSVNVIIQETRASLQKIKNGTWYGKPVASTKSGFKTWRQVNGDVNRFNIVKSSKNADEIINGTGQIVRGSGVKGFAKSIGVIGGGLAVLDGGITYLERREKYGETSAIIDGTARTATAVGSLYVGAAVGTAIPIPVVGTVAGAVAGYVVGGVVNTLYDGLAHGKWDWSNFALW